MAPRPDGVTLVFRKLQRKTSGGPGNLLCLSIVFYLSPAPTFSKFTFFRNLFFLCPFFHITFSHDCASPHPIEFKAIWPVINATPKELCLLVVSYFPSASSPTSSSSATKMAGFHYCVSPGWAPGQASHCTLAVSPIKNSVDFYLWFISRCQIINHNSVIWIHHNGNAAASETGKWLNYGMVAHRGVAKNLEV